MFGPETAVSRGLTRHEIMLLLLLLDIKEALVISLLVCIVDS